MTKVVVVNYEMAMKDWIERVETFTEAPEDIQFQLLFKSDFPGSYIRYISDTYL